MPALPAPTTTKRCWVMSLSGLSCTNSAPKTPAQAVAAVPCTQAAWLRVEGSGWLMAARGCLPSVPCGVLCGQPCLQSGLHAI